jgi:hypothetical protein
MTSGLSITSSLDRPIYALSTGTSEAGYFEINNTTSNADALFVTTNGSSSIADAIYASASGGGKAVYGYNSGTGMAGYFKVNNTANTGAALYATTNGGGYGVIGYTTGTATAGSFQINNTGSTADALYAWTSGSGNAVYGKTTGTGRAGYFQISNTANTSNALYAETNGTGYSGYFTGGAGVYVSGNLNVTGSITGDGSGLTGISPGAHTHSGADITDGTVTGAKLSVPLALSGGSDFPTVQSTNTGTGWAGYFQINNTSNTSNSLHAETNGGGRAGEFRINNTGNIQPAIYATTNGSGHVIYGFTSNSGNAVHGYTTGTGRAGYFQTNNTANNLPALYVETNGNGPAGRFQINKTTNPLDAVFASTTGTGYAGYFEGGGGVYVSGNLNVTGTKNFLQPHPTDPTKQIAYVAMEAPESAVMMRGKARLVEGRAVIETPEYFRLVAGLDEDITVQFTPRFENTIGLAAVEVTKEQIVVKERMGGKNSYEFDYFITAKRAGFEGHEPIQPNTHFTADMKTAEEFEKTYARDDMTITALRKLLVSNGILTADGKLNMELARELGWVVKDSDVAMKEAE